MQQGWRQCAMCGQAIPPWGHLYRNPDRPELPFCSYACACDWADEQGETEEGDEATDAGI